MKHSEYVKIIKGTATDVAVKTILTVTFAEIPVLGMWPLKTLIEFLVTKIVTKAFDQAEMAVFFKYIDMRVDAQGRAFTEAAIHNWQIQQTGTPDEKKQAEEQLIAAFKSFVKLSN